MEEKQLQFGGLSSIPSINPQTYIFGVYSPSPKEILIESGLWFGNYSRGERQIGVYFDTYGCVSFSALNVVEAICNLKYKNNIFSKELIAKCKAKGYINSNDEFDFSDRFTVKMSGTIPRLGNSADNVGLSICKKDGLVPETVYPYPREQRDPVFTLDEYFAEVSTELKNLGKEVFELFDMSFELVNLSDFNEAIKMSPIQVFIYAYPKADENGVYNRVDGRAVNHAVSRFEPVKDTDEVIRIFDHYTSTTLNNEQIDFIKKLSKDYIFYMYGFIYFINEKGKIMLNVIDNQEYLAIVDNSQYLCMGLNGKLVIYSQWAQTDTQARARNKKLLDEGKISEFLKKTNPITIDKSLFDSVVKIDGKGNVLTF